MVHPVRTFGLHTLIRLLLGSIGIGVNPTRLQTTEYCVIMKRYCFTDLEGSKGFAAYTREVRKIKNPIVTLCKVVKMEINPFYLSSTSALGAGNSHRDFSDGTATMSLALSALFYAQAACAAHVTRRLFI